MTSAVERTPFQFLHHASSKTIENVHHVIELYTSGEADPANIAIRLFLRQHSRCLSEYSEWKQEIMSNSQGDSDKDKLETVMEIAQSLLKQFKETQMSTGSNAESTEADRSNDETEEIRYHRFRRGAPRAAPPNAAPNGIPCFLEGEKDETIAFILSTIKSNNLSSVEKYNRIDKCLSYKNKPKYEELIKNTTASVCEQLKSLNKRSSITLKKLLKQFGTGNYKVKGYIWLSKQSNEDFVLEIVMAVINKQLQSSLNGRRFTSNGVPKFVDTTPDNTMRFNDTYSPFLTNYGKRQTQPYMTRGPTRNQSDFRNDHQNPPWLAPRNYGNLKKNFRNCDKEDGNKPEGFLYYITAAFQSISDWFSRIWTKITDTADVVWTQITDTAGVVWTQIADTAGVVLTKVKDTATEIWTSIQQGAQWVMDMIRKLWGGIVNAFKKMFAMCQKVCSKIKRGICAVISGIKRFYDCIADKVAKIF